jgi:signal peptidase II
MADVLSWRSATFRLGVMVALIAAAADQAVKLWLLYGFDLPGRGRVALGPFFDLVLVWNTGISYGLFQQVGPLGQWALFALKVIAVVLLGLWLARTGSRLSGIALGLIIGGALGNAADRFVHGAVMDFVLFHITTTAWSFPYVFNLADVAIVAGVVGLLYESLFAGDAAKAP